MTDFPSCESVLEKMIGILEMATSKQKMATSGYTSHVLIHLTQNIKEDYTMEKYIYNNNNGLWYELQGDFYIPCLTLGEEDYRPIGKWGRKHLRYIKEYRPVMYTVLLLRGKLNGHLAEIDARAIEMYDLLMKQMTEKEGINEQLKAKDPMAWVGAMNNIRNLVEEIVNTEVIFA